jgi:hypothetical protein
VAAHADGVDGQFSRIANLDNLDGEVGEHPQQVLPPRADAIGAVVRVTPLDETRESHRGIHERQQRIQARRLKAS